MKGIIGVGVASTGRLAQAVKKEDLPQARYLNVGDESGGQRLDNFLMRCLKGVPKTHIYRIIRSGEVRVNKARAHAQTKLATGDTVRLPPLRESHPRSELAVTVGPRSASVPNKLAADVANRLTILHEDDALLAINKPAGVAVHGGSGVSVGLIEALRLARPRAPLLELVHRLDRETSGVLLVAKKRSALRGLQHQFRERATGKTYFAAVLGQWPGDVRRIDTPLAKYLVAGANGDERRVRAVDTNSVGAMSAITLVQVMGRYEGFTLLEVTIRTGRTHQIRVHLANAGHPIAGDEKYGDFEVNRKLARVSQLPRLTRMFLHAVKLEFKHPVSGAPVCLQASLPEDLQVWLSAQIPLKMTDVE